jgi:hypothetical protein
MASLTMTVPRTRRIRPAHGVARLTLHVNGAYALRRIPCDPDAALEAWRLRKDDGTTYHVARTGFGPTCDCPDWTFHRDGLDPGGCKHIKALIATGLMPSE